MTLISRNHQHQPPIGERITPGSVLSSINPEHFRGERKSTSLHEIFTQIGADIVSSTNYKEVLGIIDDFEQSYEIAKTPYGYVRMSDSVSLSLQMSSHVYRMDWAPKFVRKADSEENIFQEVEHWHLPDVEHSWLPEGMMVHMKKLYFLEKYIHHVYTHEYAYRETKDSPIQVCNNWYYGWFGA